MLNFILIWVIFHGVLSEVTFLCENGISIKKTSLCDGQNDCNDGADENIRMCFRSICPTNKFRCQYGACIDKKARCNKTVECADGSDEKYCNKLETKCSDSEFQCFNGGNCIAQSQVCNGITDCLDGTDEAENFCSHVRCPKGTFRCQHGGCIHKKLLCNRVPDCPDGSDETPIVCNKMKCKNGRNCANESIHCKPLVSKGVRAVCLSEKLGHVPCNESIPVGTVAHLECDNYYSPVNSGNMNSKNEFRCQSDGNWNGHILGCNPDCGEIASLPQTLILHGRNITNWPWHAVLYIRENGKWTASCGGTLIAENIVLTAAHCVWKKAVKYLKFAFSKYQADFDRIDGTVQVSGVQKILIRPEYLDYRSNYGSDIAVVFLSDPVKFTEHVRPACLDWDLSNTQHHLESGHIGRIAGMGLMENDRGSMALQALDMPVVATDSCIKNQKRDFKKYVTYTTFCGGYANGTSLCNGDSGGGFLFQDARNPKRWILQGIVSISPRRKDNSICDPTRYTLFTKVSLYLDWLNVIIKGNTV